jgi:DNA-binding NarL/FixJ family response regulator
MFPVGDIDLVLHDHCAHEVLRVVAARRPNVKCVVLISGASPAEIDAIDAANVQAKLRKPFDLRELLDAIRHCAA